jgi:hypothetical protein
MTHKNSHPVRADNPKRAAIVISNPGVSTTAGCPVGSMWSELTHPYLQADRSRLRGRRFQPRQRRLHYRRLSDPDHASQVQADGVISRAAC